MIQQPLIDITELIQDIAKLVLKSSFIIKEISQNLNQIFYKDNLYDPVTQADYLVQQTITNFIYSKYPGLKIVGQENLETDDDICKKVFKKGQTMKSLKLNSDSMIQKFPMSKNKTFIKVSDLCLWIDPLDCTRGFVSNKRQQVTILVGITENHKPIAGLIGQPFKLKTKSSCQFDPRVFIGSIYFNEEHQKKFCYEYLFFKKNWKKWEQFDSIMNSPSQRKVAISSRRTPLRQHALMEKISLQKHEIGGAGSKFVKLIKKEVGSLMFVDAKTSKWDSCAGQAIIKAMGGFAIKPNLEQIVYNPDHPYGNNQGFIMSLSKQIFNEITEYIQTPEFQNFQNHKKQLQSTLVY